MVYLTPKSNLRTFLFLENKPNAVNSHPPSDPEPQASINLRVFLGICFFWLIHKSEITTYGSLSLNSFTLLALRFVSLAFLSHAKNIFLLLKGQKPLLPQKLCSGVSLCMDQSAPWRQHDSLLHFTQCPLDLFFYQKDLLLLICRKSADTIACYTFAIFLVFTT